jgi:protein phosphatase 1 regulatory subunit 7
MAIIIREGFKIYANGKQSIILNSDCIDECMQFYEENHLEGVAITTSHDYKLQNVDFLSNYPEIKHLSISDGIDDISAIHKVTGLESLIISGKSRKIDFSHFSALKELIADWSRYLLNIDKCVNLENLSFYNYKPKNKDCSGIPNNFSIKKLKITQSTIHSLNGLGKFNQLEELEFNYCNKLEVICELEESKETLVSLLFDHCKSIKNHDYVMQFQHLNTLAYNSSGTIPSIKFIKKMSGLRSFRFVDTDITDGDITPCIGLRYAGFSNKKHFSHTMEQIKSLSNV